MPPARGGSVYCQRRVCWLVLVFGLCAMSGLLPKAASQTVYSECGGELSAMQGTIVSPQLTSVPSGGTECVWTITPLSDMHTLSLSVNLNNFIWSPGCADSVLEMSDVPIGPNHVRLCDNDLGNGMTSYGKKVRVRLFVIPAHQNVSFSVTWTSRCEVQMTKGGTFHSPGFPDSYLAHQSCSYHFSSDSTYYETKITFTAFNIPEASGGGCSGTDYVETTDYYDTYGTYHNHRRFCGTDLPPDITNGNAFSVQFVSSEARGAGFGFEAVYTKQLRCHAGSLTNAHGTIQFPSSNRDNIEGSCTWPIMVDVGRTVVLAVNLYFNNINGTCETLYIKIYDGPTKNDNLLGTFCQSHGWQIVESSSNSLVMEFYTDGSSFYSGGYAEYNARGDDVACRKVTLDGPEGNITLCEASGLSQVWLRNGVYSWTVTVEEGFVIQLAFETYNIDWCAVSCNYYGSNMCQHGSLTVYDGLVEQKSAAIGTLCGWDKPWMMTSTTNSMVLVLVFGQEGNFTKAALSAHYRAVNGSQVKRDCGDRTLSGTGGVITSPNFPNHYDNLLDCEWIITVDEAFVVRINISEIRLQYSPNCMYDSLQVRDGNNISAPKLLTPYCGQYDIYNYWQYKGSSRTNEMFIKFVTDLTGTSAGFNATWSRSCVRSLPQFEDDTEGTLQSPDYPENYPSDLGCQYPLYLYQPGTRLVFNFTSLSLEPASSNGSCVNDYVEIREEAHWVGSSQFGRRERFCGSTLPAEFTTYFHTVVIFVTNGEVSSSGYQLTYSLVNNTECGSSFFSGQQGIVTSPNYPGSFPAHINCTQTIQAAEGETISLVFDDWLMSNSWFNPGMEGEECLQRERNGWLGGGILKIFDGPEADNASNALGVYCGQAAPLPVMSTGNSLTLVFRSYYNWNYCTGFSATFTSSANATVFTDCGGEVSGAEGVITSPAYPEHYPNNSVCEWLITGDPGEPIRLSFVDFDLEDSNSCQLDSLELRDGSNELALRLDRVCGDAIPLDVTSTGNVMHVKFVSDLDTSRPGFKANWMSLCEQIFRTSTGTIVSPSNRGHRKQCTYIIEQREWSSLVVRLQFQHFYLGGNASNCGQNYMEVRDGGFENSPLIGQRYCGNSLPPVLTSSHNMMWIRYVTDGSVSNVGFKASYSLERPSCGTATLTQKTGTFTSPGYPNIYPDGVECAWNIVAPEKHKVLLTFNTFLLEAPSGYCWWDWVKVIDGANVHGPYCGVSAPEEFTSTGNTLTVVFRSDWSVSFGGFFASYVSYDPASDELTRQYDLYPFGIESGDDQLPKGYNKVNKLTIKTGFPVGNKLHRTIFIATKGLVSFNYRDNGKKYTLRDNKDVICVYNADIRDKDPDDGGVYYQLHTDNAAVLTKATNEVREFTDLKDYTASLVLVVTWHRVRHVSMSNPDERATIQLVLVSNGQRSFGLVYYQTGAMKWQHLREEPLVIGMSVGGRVKENIYSGTKEAFTSLDTITGNTGRQGMWVYDIGDSYSADQACQDWYTRNLPLHSQRQQQFKRLPECPCNWWTLWGNWRWSHWRDGYNIYCFRMTVGNSRSVVPHGKECCYNANWWNWWEEWGQYLSDAPHAGSATAFNPADWSLQADYYREDRQAHDICCYNTSTSDYCSMYYELRPIGECTTRIPFSFSFTWGDPHIKTLDGGEYTFNGLGEYIMISIATPSLTFTLQGRTGLAETEKGTVANATVFTAFGAKENGVGVTVDLDPNTNDTLVIYGNGTDYTSQFYQNGNEFSVENEAYLLKNTNSTLEVRFTSDIQLTISIGYKSLDISVTMPLKFKGQTKGLMGNFNGVKDDDFILPDGTTLTSNLTDRQIWESFGPHWAVTEANTVLRYPPREGPADYAHPEFQPIFLDEQPADVRQAAEDLCGATNLACVYDYVATGSKAIATSTKNTADNAKKTDAASKNTVPVLKFNSTVSVTSGSPSTFSLQGHDPDEGDTLTYRVVGDSSNSVVVDPDSGEVTLTLTASTPVSLSFYAVDSNNAPSPKRDVTIIVCPTCSGHGTCNVINAVASGVSGFMIAPCDCHPAWTGTNCSQDYDACRENPCSLQQTCRDLTPSQQGNSTTGFTCTACGDGYVRDPEDSTICIDIDECADSTAHCSSRCINLPGHYECGCDVGYRLNNDGITCDDINECADRTAGCQQDCVNTAGSFNCTCYPGYTLSSNKGACKPDQTTADVCGQAGCAHGCTTVTNSSGGSPVPSCFCNAGYAPSPSNASACVDVDECGQDVCSQACTNTVGSFACTCYTGHVLGADQRTCTPCQGLRYGPECRLTCTCNGHATRCDPVTGCVCASGWTGSQCERDVDECAETPGLCGSKKICSNTQGSYACNCPTGYKKNAAGQCEDINECAEGYLQTTCGQLETCHNVEGSYYCSCISGYSRQRGQCVDVDECSGSTQRCEQLCINRPGSFNCDCHYGYRLDQERTQCIQVGDVCKEFEGLDCDQGCTLDDRDVAVCFCNAGYKLASDGETCLDADECTSGVANCSHTCTNTPAGFNCTCPVGKTLDNDGKTCQDCPAGFWGENCVHQCACGIGSTGCDAATGCECLPGWTGAQCDQDVNECDTERAQLECQAASAVCDNYQGGYRCQCPQGYKKDSAGVCQDINECSNSPCSQLCENVAGGYRCLCNKGYRLNATTGACQDINECALSFTNNCTQRCVNTPGGYRCDCNDAGFQLQNDGFTCKAVSSCSRPDCPIENGGCSQEKCFCNSRYQLSSGSSTCTLIAVDYCSMGVCEQNCTNSPDGTSYTCSCGAGYLLNSDKSTCMECRNGTYGPGCSQTCTCNTRNTLSCNKVKGVCTCKAGWEGATCDADIDECSPSSAVTCTAHAHAQCVNTQGGYLCACDIGYTKVAGNCVACDANHYGENCAQSCDCSVNSLSCNKVNGACACKAGWEGARCDVDVDECTMGSAGCSGDHVVCVNRQGGVSCDCNKGYTRDDANTCVDKDECFSQESDCLHLCNNTIGGYVCSCGPEYQGTGNDCTELPRVPALVIVDIPVPAWELANPYSDIYKKWVSDVRQALYEKLKPGVPGLKLVIIQSLRPGSLIADTVFVVDTQNQPNTISALSSAILALMKGQLVLRNYTGSVTLNIHGIMVNQSVTLCDVYVAISPCGVTEECQETSGIASCVPTEEEHEEDVDLDLVIGLAVSIPMALLIAGVIGVAVYLHKRPNVQTLPQVNHDEVYSVSPASSNLHGGKPGLGQIDTRWIMAPSPISASPVPSLDSILPDMDSRPASRTGSWTNNM